MITKHIEDLLTKDDMIFVINDAKIIKDEGNSDMFWISKGKTAIQKVSDKTDLILVYGNNYTGYEHILNRHFYFHKPFRKDNGNDTPSKFPNQINPIDLIPLAESIYKEENKKLVEDSCPFDIYEGKYGALNIKEAKYRLLTYKETGIIHTFYVCDNNKPFNVKTLSKFYYYKTAVRYAYNTETCEHILRQGYIDDSHQKVFEFIFYFNLFEKTKKVSIKVFNSEKEVIAEKELSSESFTLKVNSDYFLSLASRLDSLENKDYEKLAKDFLQAIK